ERLLDVLVGFAIGGVSAVALLVEAQAIEGAPIDDVDAAFPRLGELAVAARDERRAPALETGQVEPGEGRPTAPAPPDPRGHLFLLDLGPVAGLRHAPIAPGSDVAQREDRPLLQRVLRFCRERVEGVRGHLGALGKEPDGSFAIIAVSLDAVAQLVVAAV